MKTERFLSFGGSAARIAPVRDLLQEPLWRAEDLGVPIPDSPHACLVSLPTWDAVIGYEEMRPDVIDRLRAGYPRFFIHPKTAAMFAEIERRFAREGERAVVFPRSSVASRASAFVERRHGFDGRQVEEAGLHALIVPEEAHGAARDYWRHTGEIVSSRQAEDFLEGRSMAAGDTGMVRESLARILEVAPDDCFVLESGMAAIFSLYRAVTARKPGAKTLQLCFPYVDALKIQEHFGAGVDFLPCLTPGDLETVLEAIRANDYAAVFCEVPSNPLLETADLPKVSEACREAGVPLLVDDTVCSHHNVNAFPWADAISTSLTKWVSGIGDVMAGSIKLNRKSVFADELRQVLEAEIPGGSRLYHRDAEVLLRNARGFPERAATANPGGEQVAEFLAGHPAVERVWYPKFEGRERYDLLRRSDGGYGGLMSFSLKRPDRAPAVFDAVELCKGPSLGTEYSLLCPYTLLAHYTELDWAARWGVPAHLLRLSVGLEPPGELISCLERALESA